MTLQKHFETPGRKVLVVLQQHRLLPQSELEVFFRTNRNINFVFYFRPSRMSDSKAISKYFSCLSHIYPGQGGPVIPKHREEALAWLQTVCTSEMSTWVLSGQLATAEHLFLKEILDTDTIILGSYDGWDKKDEVARAADKPDEGSSWTVSTQRPKFYWTVMGHGSYSEGFWDWRRDCTPKVEETQNFTVSDQAPVLELDSSNLIIPCPHLKTNPGCCFVQPPMLVQLHCRAPYRALSFRYYDFGPGAKHEVAVEELEVQNQILEAMKDMAQDLRTRQLEDETERYSTPRDLPHVNSLSDTTFTELIPPRAYQNRKKRLAESSRSETSSYHD